MKPTTKIRPLRLSTGAWFNIDTPKPLSEWIKMFEHWKKTYGDVVAKTDAGYSNVDIVLNLEKDSVDALNVQKYRRTSDRSHDRNTGRPTGGVCQEWKRIK
jgi:hypothetical protein